LSLAKNLPVSLECLTACLDQNSQASCAGFLAPKHLLLPPNWYDLVAMSWSTELCSSSPSESVVLSGEELLGSFSGKY
jgi:hypothetical protein